jgi:hypothetical protein
VEEFTGPEAPLTEVMTMMEGLLPVLVDEGGGSRAGVMAAERSPNGWGRLGRGTWAWLPEEVSVRSAAAAEDRNIHRVVADMALTPDATLPETR